MDYAVHLLKTFTDRAYRHTAMVTHKGTIVAFAMDDQRRLFYSVLDLDKATAGGQAGSLGELDVKYWEEPRAVPFPREISQVGYSIVNPTRMPVVKKDSGGAEADPGELRPEEIDLFHSTTARMTADAPFQVLSDGKLIYLFRQSTGKDDKAAVFKTKDGGASAAGQRPAADYVTDGEGALVPIADSTLLVDRLVLTGAALSPKMEVRYRRSRNKHVPQSAKDSLGAEDMNQQPFHEPTHELDFVHGLRDGRFSVLLLPTQVADVMAWQIFTYNSANEQIDSFNVERSADGLFNTQGTTFYTSPDPQYRASVFEREPGTCPFTGEALIPLIETAGYAESALSFNGSTTKVQVAGYKGITGSGARTVEAWIKTSSANAPIAAWGSTATGGKWTFLVQSANGTTGAIRVEVAGGYVVGATPVNDGQWHHVACTFDASGGNDVTAVRLYVDGVLEPTSATAARAVNTAAGVDLLIGYDHMNRHFAGLIDEVRIWDRARGGAEIQSDMSFRLAGNEPGLAAYYRFDDGRGSTARDQSGHGRNGTILARPPIVLSLNGTADHVDCGQIDFAGNGYTVEAWFKADPATTDQRALFAASTGTTHGVLVELSAGGTLRCYHRAPGGTGTVCEFYTTSTYKDGRWHHVAAVKDGTSVTLYVDGGKVGTAAATTQLAEPLTVVIGRLSQAQALRHFKGSIAEVRLWGHARSQAEIQAFALRRLTGTEAGLTAYWPLDEGTGAVAADRSGKGHDGALKGAPIWAEDLPAIEPPSPVVTPAASNAVSFDGVNDKIDVPFAAALNPESLTVEAWVMSQGGSSYRSPLTCRSDFPPKGYIFYATDQGKWAFWVGNGTSFNNLNGPSVQLNVWVHLAGTYDKATQTMRFYVNGVEAASLAGVTYVPNSTAPLRIGAGKSETTGDYFFNGKIMEVRVWSRARTAQEIQADMNRRLAGTEAGLAGYWPLDEGTGTTAKDRSGGGRNGTLLNSPTWASDAPALAPAPAPAPVFEGTLRSGSLERPEADWVASSAPVGERPGFHRASFSFLGRTVVSGLTSVLYHQQEQAMVGYDQQAKPVKRSARVMLAVSTGDAAGGGTPSYVAALDLGVSRHGRLAQTPDVIDLGAPLTSDANKDLARLQELEQRMRAGGATAEIQTEAQQIRQRLSVDVALPMPLLHTDAFGLTAAGGLLGFAYTGDTPYLFDSATGKLALYFRGDTGQFFAAHYDTSTTRAQMRLPAGGGELVFAARSAEPEADQTTVTVSDGPSSTFCTVVIANPKVGITETWKRVPRQGLAFASVLNGQAGTPVFLGALAAAAGGTVTSLALAEGARRPLEAGDTLLVGDAKVTVSANVARGSKALPIDGAALSAAAGAQVSLLPYDSSAHASTNRAIDRLESGSLFFSVVPNGAGVAAQNGSASASAVTPSCHWRAESPGNALFFQGTAGSVTRQGDAAALAKLDAEGDLTLEAWINPVAVQGTARVIHHLTDGSRYTLGLQDASIGQAALKLDGVDDEVDLKTGLLNNLSAFTLEAWIRPSTKTGVSRGILGQRWVVELVLREDGTLTVWVNTHELNPLLSVPYPHPVNEWHHVAVTGSGRDLRVYVDGVRQYGTYENYGNTHPFTTYGTSDAPAAIGHQTTVTQSDYKRFAGEIDEVRYWGYARSQSDIREAMSRRLKGNESGLLGYWYFSSLEISQGRVLDKSGNGRHGYLMGLPIAAPTLNLIKGNVFFAGVGDQVRRSAVPVLADTWQHLAAVFRQSYALGFDGKDDVLTAEHGAALSLNRDMTLEVFFRADDVSVPQGLVSKGRLHDGTSDAVPYALYVAEGGRLALDYEDKNGTTHHFESSRSIQAGTFYRVAVTRKHDILVENKGSEAAPDVKVNHVTTVNFYMNLTEAGSARRFAPTPGENRAQLQVGVVADGNKTYRLKGITSEVRLWNRCLALQEVGRPLRGDEEGLVAWWRMEENEGGVTRDAKGEHHAAIQGPTWVKNPDPDGSSLTLYHNGTPILAEPMATPDWYSGTRQFTLGASRSGSDVKFPFQGTMEEVRIWKTARSQEQLLDNLFSRLKGEKQDLIANYTFDEGTGTVVEDQGLRGNHLALGGGAGAPAWTLSTAPISTDIAPVRSALAGIKTAFHDVIGSPPTVQEYADLQVGADGNLGGVMKRCYGYVKEGAWHLMTGYKVGNLTTEWVGQVQADPQIIGFIEGAPPVPSENMTSTSAKVGEYADYNGTAVIELEEPKTVNYVFSSSAESGYDMAFDLSTKTGVQSKSQVGFGFITEVEDTRARIGLHTTFESSTSDVHQAESSFGRNVTKTTRMELHGYWEEPENQGGKYINPSVGRRYVPENNGLALVQSDTMDVFALRLAHNGALVAYRMRPNPDIPKDWNILMFPINPRYVKQGTLDGRVGAREDGSVQVDPDYPQAAQYGEYSYFKPREAYALKKRIEREQQALATYYRQYSAAQSISDQSTGSDVPERIASRNLANTYVWTAEGGFFAETSEVMEATSESTSGSYSFTGMTGIQADFNLAIMKTATIFEIEALFGGHLETSKSRAMESDESFKLSVSVAPDSDLQLHVNTEAEAARYAGHIDQESLAAWHPDGTPVLRPGRVDAYRFMTFYLEPARENFEDFFHKVVDPIWLAQSDDPDAMALRKAQQVDKKPRCWRILHRVTFVSRILPEIDPGAPATTVQQAMALADVSSNWALIKKLEPFVRTRTESYSTFAAAVEQTLSTYLPELVPHAQEVTAFAASYFGVSTD